VRNLLARKLATLIDGGVAETEQQLAGTSDALQDGRALHLTQNNSITAVRQKFTCRTPT